MSRKANASVSTVTYRRLVSIPYLHQHHAIEITLVPGDGQSAEETLQQAIYWVNQHLVKVIESAKFEDQMNKSQKADAATFSCSWPGEVDYTRTVEQ
jgi:uncharacterized protein YlxP (DUF503 family)